VKLLLDQNLSPRLVGSVADLFAEDTDAAFLALS
jgi:hypothetical protein